MTESNSITEWIAADKLINGMSRDQLAGLLNIYTRLIMTVDGLWFLPLEKKYGIEEAIRIDEDVWRDFGRISAMRIGKFLSVDPANINDICDAILLSPMFICLGGTAEVVDDRCYLSVTDCLPQKARVRKMLGEFPCKTVGVAYFEGLVSGLNPAIKFRCMICPPDEHPGEVWCKWEIAIEP